jgi:hypothetical protein
MTADERAALAKAVCDAMHEVDPFYVSYDHAIAAIDIIRAETLEEAARVCDAEADLCTEGCDSFTANCCATNIRALKETP